MTTLPTISKERAKAFAVLIYEQIPQFCQENQQEYIEFLKNRAGISENARKELARLHIKNYMPIIFFACAKIVVNAEWLKQVALHEQESSVAYLEWRKEQNTNI